MKLFRLFSLWMGLALLARADVTLAPLFQDHAVLQRDQPIHIWGWANVGDEVTVSLADTKTTARADSAGK